MSESMIKSTIVLTGVCIVSAILLSLAYIATAEKIDMQAEIALKENLNAVLPDADSFIEKEEMYVGMKDGQEIGYAALAESQGYGSVIKILIGINMDEEITGVRIMQQEETPGLGANAVKPDFYSQFDNLKLKDVKLSKEGGKIDAITGATITSRAVVDGVRATIEKRLEGMVKEKDIDAITQATERYVEKNDNMINGTLEIDNNITIDMDDNLENKNMSENNA